MTTLPRLAAALGVLGILGVAGCAKAPGPAGGTGAASLPTVAFEIGPLDFGTSSSFLVKIPTDPGVSRLVRNAVVERRDDGVSLHSAGMEPGYSTLQGQIGPMWSSSAHTLITASEFEAIGLIDGKPAVKFRIKAKYRPTFELPKYEVDAPVTGETELSITLAKGFRPPQVVDVPSGIAAEVVSTGSESAQIRIRSTGPMRTPIGNVVLRSPETGFARAIEVRTDEYMNLSRQSSSVESPWPASEVTVKLKGAFVPGWTAPEVVIDPPGRYAVERTTRTGDELELVLRALTPRPESAVLAFRRNGKWVYVDSLELIHPERLRPRQAR